MEERESFWEGLGECVGSFDERERILVLGDLNSRVGDEVVDGITGAYGVPGVNEW